MTSIPYRYDDPVTGRPVTRLTSLDEHCHHPYFYNRCFTRDSRRAVTLVRRDGCAEIRLTDIETGACEPLTAGRDIEEFLVTLSHDDRYLYYSRGQALHRVRLDTREDDTVWVQEPPWNGGSICPGYSDDFRRVLLAQMHRDDRIIRDKGWDFFEPQWRAHPRCRLVLLELDTGAARVVHEDACWLGHPQLRPGNPDTLMFCHEGPGNLIDARVWLIDADGNNLRCMGYRETEPGAGAPDYITHECFTPDGESIAYLRLAKQRGDPTRVRLRKVNDFSLQHDLAAPGYLHVCPSPDSRRLVGDQRGTNGNGCIRLLDPTEETDRPLCLHGSSFAPRGASTQDAHPHPTFAPDGRRILFSSDRETGPDGPCAVYLVEADPCHPATRRSEI